MFGFLRRFGRGGDEPPRRPPSIVDQELPFQLERLLDRYVEEALEIQRREGLFTFTDAGLCPVTGEVDALPREAHCRLVLGAARLQRSEYQTHRHAREALQALQSRLMRRELPFTEEQLAGLLGEFPQYLAREHCPERALARAVERHVQRHGLTPSLRAALEAAVARVKAPSYSGQGAQVMASTRQMVERLQALLDGGRPTPERSAFKLEQAALDWLVADDGDRAPWQALMALFRKSAPARPDERWLSKVASAVAAIGREAFADRLVQVLNRQEVPGQPDDRHNVLRQFIWASVAAPEPALVEALGQLAKERYRSFLNDGVANACTRALAEIGNWDAIAQLVQLKHSLGSNWYDTAVFSALARVKETAGLTDGEIEEVAVPHFDLDDEGRRAVTVGRYQAIARLIDPRTVDLRWLPPDGQREQKTVPASVKRDYASELTDVRALVRRIREVLRIQRRRIEGLLAAERVHLARAVSGASFDCAHGPRAHLARGEG